MGRVVCDTIGNYKAAQDRARECLARSRGAFWDYANMRGADGERVGNTTIRNGHDAGEVLIRFHATDILIYHPDNGIAINPEGWFTVTVKERLNRFGPFRLWQERGWWYVEGKAVWECGTNRRGTWNGGPGQRNDRRPFHWHPWEGSANVGFMNVPEAVAGIAAGIVNDGAYDRLPILADALEDAGETGDVLAFLRRVGAKGERCNTVHKIARSTGRPFCGAPLAAIGSN